MTEGPQRKIMGKWLTGMLYNYILYCRNCHSSSFEGIICLHSYSQQSSLFVWTCNTRTKLVSKDYRMKYPKYLKNTLHVLRCIFEWIVENTCVNKQYSCHTSHQYILWFVIVSSTSTTALTFSYLYL